MYVYTYKYLHYKRKLNAISTKLSTIMQKGDEKFGRKSAINNSILRTLIIHLKSKYLKTFFYI